MDPHKLELQMVVSYHVGASQPNPGPLEGHPVLLIAEPSFQPLHPAPMFSLCSPSWPRIYYIAHADLRNLLPFAF